MSTIDTDVLNDDWIRKFENIDQHYSNFYKDDLCYVNINAVYINTSNEIDKINSEPFLLSKPNFIAREEIIRILKKYTERSETKNYSLLTILKYNFFLDVDEVVTFLKCTSQDLEYYNKQYLSSVKYIDSIYFEKTISMFHDLNEVYFIFYEKESDSQQNSHNITKKIYLRHTSNHKKTIRNK